MTDSKHPAWKRHLDGIGEELLRLSVACQLTLREPGVIDRILQGDESVCGTKNPIGFRKLRSLLQATYSSVNKAAERIGTAEVKTITDGIIARIDELQARGGRGP
ncbi:MAG: hypothetical protein IT485_02505 [Gammaproteobacteria bacterium]|nr:hypothetical protein [Gammaproteobacteria bacterium]QOJ32376.1 MAG: hypothetical protein HRU81_09805 [Gammaproteobacteria bacterium]